MTASREDLTSEALRELESLAAQRRRALCQRPPHRELSLPQFHVLLILMERGPTTLSELASILDISAPSTSSIVDRMEERGLLVRERDTVDRRIVHVRASELGRSTAEEMMGMKRELLQSLLDRMTDQELGDFVGGLKALQSALSRTQGAATSPGTAAE